MDNLDHEDIEDDLGYEEDIVGSLDAEGNLGCGVDDLGYEVDDVDGLGCGVDGVGDLDSSLTSLDSYF